jgi:GH15 family glucan-1,4-alpha-glucosidase
MCASPRHSATSRWNGRSQHGCDPDCQRRRQHPARNIVGGDFLQLVRLGVRAANDPLIVDSIAVIDQVLKHDLPQGPCWRRYNHDGYGQKDDGSAYDGTGVGRSGRF